MPNKQAIIENVDMYSADELVKYIKAGIVTFEELCDETEGYFLLLFVNKLRRNLQDQKKMNGK